MTFAAAALIAVATLVAAPRASAAVTLGVTGTVKDATSGLPLDNVCVTLGPPLRCWTATNAQGQYLIDLTGLGPAGQQWTMWFLRGGFEGQSQTITVNGLETLNVSLVRSPGVTSPPAVPTPPNLVQPVVGAPPVSTAFTVYLPNITKTLGGPTGWHTPFIVQNVGTVSTQLTVAFYAFSDGSLVATRSATVLPGRSFVDSPRDEADLPGNSQFSVVINAVGAPVVAVVNEHQGPGAGNEALSYSGISTGSTSVYLPLVSKNAGGWLTTLIMQNVGTVATSMTASFVSLDGTKTGTITRTIDPGRSQFIDPRFEGALADGTEYSASLTASQPIAVVSNNHHDLPGVTPAMGDSYNGVAASTATTTYLPYVAKNTDGVGRTSRVIVQNTGTTAATPSISLLPFGGGNATSVSAPQLAPGGAFQFTPSVADGEYSGAVSGGTFAAVVATVSASGTALYYTGTAGPSSKLFVPNITRKLTQDPTTDPGWNTPILIQSATATSATLTWYRFSDGSLVTTQTVSLAANVTTRIDPALVSGLADNNQYAVVIESAGTLVAIVTELNLIGGDDAMIYKGFAAP
jgi:hypothetical protein